jgi:hypothetical protein
MPKNGLQAFGSIRVQSLPPATESVTFLTVLTTMIVQRSKSWMGSWKNGFQKKCVGSSLLFSRTAAASTGGTTVPCCSAALNAVKNGGRLNGGGRRLGAGCTYMYDTLGACRIMTVGSSRAQSSSLTLSKSDGCRSSTDGQTVRDIVQSDI